MSEQWQSFPDDGLRVDYDKRLNLQDQKIQRVNEIMNALVIAVVVALLVGLISVVGIFLDQARFNHATYREFSKNIQNETTSTSTSLSAP